MGYMMATKAEHLLGDLSRDEPDLCWVEKEAGDAYIGNWVTGYGFVNVHFPKETTRDLTDEERAMYNGMAVQISDGPAIKLDIPETGK